MKHILTWRISGMHCASCERLIEQELRSIPGVTDVEVSLTQERAGISYETDIVPDFSSAFATLGKQGYSFEQETTETPSKQHHTNVCAIPSVETKPFSKETWLRALIAFIGTSLVFLVILRPLLQRVPSINSGASVAAIFGLGIVASLSTCLASTGGYLLAFSTKKPSKTRTAIIHLGRLSSFAVGGFLLGTLGGSLPVLGSGFYGTLALVLGIGFLIAGLNLLNLSPSLAKLGIRIPKSFANKADRIAESNHSITPFLVGASTFILPCGFTQTAQALTLASGDGIRGLVIMLSFALGTLPVLGGLTFFGSLATLKHQTVRLIAGSALVLFAISQINGGLVLLGSPITPSTLTNTVFAKQAKNPPAATDTINPSEQIIRMSVTASGYKPSALTVKAGIPVRWEIDGNGAGGCTRDIVVPSLNIEKTLTKGTNLITFTPKTPGTIPFSCGMGMVQGTIRVIN